MTRLIQELLDAYQTTPPEAVFMISSTVDRAAQEAMAKAQANPPRGRLGHKAIRTT